ncbi:MAG: hypothetical protein ACJ79Q_06520 [Gemmatimonadaceae bacterium]|jgi:hypothetical protein
MLLGSTPRVDRSLRSHRRGVAFLCVAALFAVVSCATVDTAVTAEPGSEFALALGKTATISGTGTRMTFRQVSDDSRCPVDVQCVWAGDAKIELVVSRSGSQDDAKILSLAPPNNETSSGDLRIRFVGLAPAPRSTEDRAQRKYVAHLVVNRG